MVRNGVERNGGRDAPAAGGGGGGQSSRRRCRDDPVPLIQLSEQSVISGQQAAVERAVALAKERGAGRVVTLNVSAPFHSSLMQPLRQEMAAVLGRREIQPPRVPVIANGTADYVRTPDEIRAALADQVAGAVRWLETLNRRAGDGITRIVQVEIGTGRVLTGLTKRTLPGVETMTYEPLLGSQRPA